MQASIDFARENQSEAAAIIADYLTLDAADVEAALDTFIIEISFTQEDYDNVQNIADWAAENGVIEAIQIGDYTNSSAIAAAYPDKVSYQAQ